MEHFLKRIFRRYILSNAVKGDDIMKTKFKNLIYSLTIFGFVFSASTVLAQPGFFKRDHDMKRIQEMLNLSTEQQELMDVHKAKRREQMEAFHKSMMTTREAMKTELEKEEPNMDTINQIQSELKVLDATKADHRLEGILEVREILTPEQFSEFMELKGKHRGWKGKRCGPPELSEEQ